MRFRKKKDKNVITAAEVEHLSKLEQFFEEDKKEAEYRVALIRARLRALQQRPMINRRQS